MKCIFAKNQSGIFFGIIDLEIKNVLHIISSILKLSAKDSTNLKRMVIPYDTQNKKNEAGTSLQQFLLKTALEKEIIHIKEFQELIFQIKKIGINLNQIVKHCNEIGTVSDADISEIKGGLDKIWLLLNQSKIHIPT